MNTPAGNPVRSRIGFVHLTFLSAAIGAIAFRLWTSFCFFPLAEWNNVRLAPTFMLRFGSTPYPGLDGGPLTTWIYGPVPLLINLPAVLAHDTVGALLIAETINLLCAIVPAAFAVFAMTGSRPDVTRTDRLWVLLLCLALWPNPSLHYIQADNIAVAFGLMANLLLFRARNENQTLLMLAAFCTALAVWSKQTSLGLILAQLLWLGFAVGRQTAVRYAIITAVIGLAIGAVFVAWFGFAELWLNMVRIPGLLPFCDDAFARSLSFWMHLTGYVLLPMVGLFVARRTIWRRDSRWLLPALTWLCLLPTALLSIYKIGGATNSLNCILYLLPISALAVVNALRRLNPLVSRAWIAAGILLILTQQLKFSPLLPLRPVTTQLVEAERLAREFPRQIYFPWHPLITFFSDRRFYHTEDGLYTREAAQIELNRQAVLERLPPEWSITAIPGWRSEGTFTQLQPSHAQLGFIGKWSVYTWSTSAASKRKK